jgi:hypothetical protein
MGNALGRVRFIQGLLNLKSLYNVKYHLLGCSIPQEFGWYDNHPKIESIDTSNPIMAALDNTLYTRGGLTTKPKANMNDNFNIGVDEVDYALVLENTKRFRKINGFKNI